MFSKNKSIQELLALDNELADIGGVLGLLSWDQQVNMPPMGAASRAKQLSTLSGIYHTKITDKKLGTLLKTFNSKKINAKLNVLDLALVRELTRAYERSTKIPESIVKEMSEIESSAFEAWHRAKDRSDFKLFERDLEKVLDINIKAIKFYQKKGQSVYDVMLDIHERGLTEKEVDAVFSKLKGPLSALAKKLARLSKGAGAALKNKRFDPDSQWNFGLKIASDMGYNLAAGRQDKSAHPFTTGFSVNDVRITTRVVPEDLRPALFATIHETGHALYDQGIAEGIDRTHLGGGTGHAMHESQSRLWENIVGRGLSFWKHYYPILQKTFPVLRKVSLLAFVRAINNVEPSLIRIEADEVTYGLHIILRFEIERELIAGKIKVKDLPKVWNKKMGELLGVTPKKDSQGVLQDVHWSGGSFGYFPTYLLGTMISAQLWNSIKKEIPNIENQIEKGNLKTLREWLRDKIHKHGKVYTTKELLLKITGEPLNPEHFLNYLEEKFEKLYSR